MTTTKKHYDNNEDVRIALLEQSIGHVNQTLLRIEKRLDNMEDNFDKRLDRIEARIDKLDNRIDKLENRIWLLIATALFGVISSLAKVFGFV